MKPSRLKYRQWVKRFSDTLREDPTFTNRADSPATERTNDGRRN